MKIAIPALADGTVLYAQTPYDGTYKVFVADFSQGYSSFVCALRDGSYPDNIDISVDIPNDDLNRQLRDGFDVRPGKDDNRKLRLNEIIDSLIQENHAHKVE